MPYRSLRIAPLTSSAYFCFGHFSVLPYIVKRMRGTKINAMIII